MTNHEWCEAEGKIRDLVDDMSVKQLKSLLTNLGYEPGSLYCHH